MVEQAIDAFAHLFGRLIGKSHGKNRVRRNALFADQPGDAARNDTCFSRARPGKDEQRAFSGLDGGALFGIQFVDERLQDARPGGKGSFLLVYCLGRQRNGNGSRDDQRPRSQLREEWPYEMHILSKIDKLCILI